MNILLQPSSDKEALQNFEDTIGNGVSTSILKDYLPEGELQKISRRENSRIKVWGMTANSRNESRREWSSLKENGFST